ncbi:MAG: disulfide bond formation protein B [Erythrobacter sp.]|uniref:disulfide bond formation protein B n=1 Tax=Erythrobacter sp. TaxID=1042 RepID=UPI0032664042
MTGLSQARTLAVFIPAALLGGAYISQYGFDLYPCEMCWWQRYPHFAALGFGLASFAIQPSRVWIALAGLAIITSGLIGGFHAGVEYGWWEGITGCSTLPSEIDVMDINAAPLVRCDVAPWDLFGVSLAGWNFLISCLGGVAVVAMATYKK